VAIFVALLLRLLPDQITASFSAQFFELLVVIIGTNVFIGIFNLLPFPPLDGSKIVLDFFPMLSEKLRNFFEKYGVFLLIFFVLFSGQLIYGVVRAIVYFLLGGSIISS
jgi:membrane-associated protease RseP (regulator of RpoE activity)